MDASVEQLTTEASQERDDDVDDVAFVAERIERPGAVVFQVTTGGMACGPVWETTAFGLELTRVVEGPVVD